MLIQILWILLLFVRINLLIYCKKFQILIKFEQMIQIQVVIYQKSSEKNFKYVLGGTYIARLTVIWHQSFKIDLKKKTCLHFFFFFGLLRSR